MKNRRFWWIIGSIVNIVSILIAVVLLALFWAGVFGENNEWISFVMIGMMIFLVLLVVVTIFIFKTSGYKHRKRHQEEDDYDNK